ncbi:MAG TPA: cytochrome c-type biogenesis protein [Casimicrobiaceae bacterium]
MGVFRRAIGVLVLGSAWLAASAAALSPPASDAALDERLKKLETGLRCLVCQNQTLAESNADLAADLRREVRELALAGKSDDEIRAYLVARYGDFVLYSPPLKGTTWLLWLGPFALLAGGGALWWLILRRRERGAGSAATDSDPQAELRARKLLDEQSDTPA